MTEIVRVVSKIISMKKRPAAQGKGPPRGPKSCGFSQP